MSNGLVWSQRVRQEVAKAVIGQAATVEHLLVAIITGGHVLLEGMPGLAKTLLVKSLATALGVRFERIQFTPDLLPSDVVGTIIFSPKTGEFTPYHGPIFANLVLADEINRSPAKVQSALLEAMQERQVTIGGQTHALPKPFFVMATQNPVDQDGTYALPEAQTDRFLFKLLVDYPSATEERALLGRWGQLSSSPELMAVSSPEEIIGLRKVVDGVHVAPELEGYILDLVRNTRLLRKPDAGGLRLLNFGASPRASLALFQAVGPLAWLRGMEFVTPALIQEMAPEVLRHRLGLTYEAEAAGQTTDDVVRRVIHDTPVPSV